MNEFNRLEFVKSQKPVEPLHDWRFWILAGPIISSVIGIATTSMFSLAFDNVSIIPTIIQSWIAVIGSVITVFASEANSPGTFFELYRRIFKEEKVTSWDYAALVLSTIGSLATILIVCAIAIMTSDTFPKDAPWISLVVAWMPLIATTSIVGDNMGALIELASLYASYETRIDAWYSRVEQEQERMSTEDFQSPLANFQKQIDDLQSQIEYLQSPPADLQWFKSQVSGLNGSSAKYQHMNVLDAVQAICRDGGKRFTLSERTAHSWYKEYERVVK